VCGGGSGRSGTDGQTTVCILALEKGAWLVWRMSGCGRVRARHMRCVALFVVVACVFVVVVNSMLWSRLCGVGDERCFLAMYCGVPVWPIPDLAAATVVVGQMAACFDVRLRPWPVPTGLPGKRLCVFGVGATGGCVWP
jgi:hypothetical protein